MLLAQYPQRVRAGIKSFCRLVERRPYVQNQKSYGRISYYTPENVKRVLESATATATASAGSECERCDKQLSAFAHRGYYWGRVGAKCEYEPSIFRATALCPGVYSPYTMSPDAAAHDLHINYYCGMRSNNMLGRCYMTTSKNDTGSERSGISSSSSSSSSTCCGCNDTKMTLLKPSGTNGLHFTPDLELCALPMPTFASVAMDSASMLRPYIISHRFQTEQHLQLMFGLFRMYALKKFQNLHEVYYCQDCLRFMLAGLSPVSPLICQETQQLAAVSVDMLEVPQAVVTALSTAKESTLPSGVAFEGEIAGPIDLPIPFAYHSKKRTKKKGHLDGNDKQQMEQTIILIAMIHAMLVFFALWIIFFPDGN